MPAAWIRVVTTGSAMTPDREHAAPPERPGDRSPDRTLDRSVDPRPGLERGGPPGPAERDVASTEALTETRTETAGLTAAEPRNRVLRALPPDEYARLLRHLEPVTVARLEVLAETGRPLDYVYFPETAILSVVRRLRDGTHIGAYAVGREGVAGIPSLLGDPGSPAGAVLGEVPGLCRRVPLATLRALLPELPSLQQQVLRLTLALLDQVQQAVACNSVHTVEQRCARWLLMTHDQAGAAEFHLTHDVLAQMLAVRRAGVTIAAGELQKSGLIAYSRGRVRVLNRAGLEAAACGCYAVVRAHTERLLGEDVRVPLPG